MTSNPLYEWLIWVRCDIISTLYDITRVYSWHHIHCIHDITPTVYDITYTLLVTSQPLYLWKDTNSVYDILVYMTSHMVCEWQHNHCIRCHIHCICVITPTWLTISYPVYVWNHTHCMYDTRGTVYDITSTLDDIIPLFVCHGNHYVYDIISTTYDVTQIVCMTTQALYLTCNPFYLPSHPLYMSWHLLCRIHHPNYVRHHRWHIFAIIYTIQNIISTLYDHSP